MATRIYQQRVVVQELVLNGHDCPSCGVVYAITEDYEARRREDGRSWQCPNGHGISFDSDARRREAELRKFSEDLTKRLEAEKGWLANLSASLEAEQKSHAATKGQLTKTRKRIENGVCPDCHRHFTNLERHMASKHGAQA